MNDLLAVTSNGNESGTLWEKEWRRDDDGYYSQLVCSGVFVGPWRYDDERAFWRAFEDERSMYRGRRLAAQPA